MSEGPAKRRWFQFTIARCLLATFWFSVTCAAWPFDDASWLLQWVALRWGLLIVPPFIAFGTLFGRARIAALIGMVCYFGWLAFVAYEFTYGW